MLQSTHKYAIRFFDTHRSDLQKELASKGIIFKLIQIIGALIINPANILKRRESIRNIYSQYLNSVGNEENIMKMKKEL